MKRKSPSTISKYLPPVIAIAVILAVWQGVCMAGWVPSFMLPSPVQVVQALVKDFPLLASHAGVTLLETFIGMTIGILIGFVLALLMDRYEILRKAVDLGKGRSQDYVLDDLMNVSAQRFKNKKDNEEYREALLQDYVDCASYIDEFINNQTDEKTLERALTCKERIDGLFINSGAADCAKLQEIYGPKIENHKDDLEYLTKVVKIMQIFECNTSDAYFAASEYAHAISPSARTAKALGALYYKQRDDTDKAIEYYNQAIELDDDKSSIAGTYYLMASLYFAKDNYDRSRSCIQKCLQNNPNRGDAYILLAQLYYVKRDWSSEPALNRCAYFAVIDKLEQAKKVDSSVAARANELISSYKKQCPQPDDLFMLGYKVGDQVEIKGWINETTTIR